MCLLFWPTGPWCSCRLISSFTMSTSDSDYSIDWLASDEDDYDSPKRLSPQHAASPLVSLSSSTSSSREPPTSLFHSGDTQRRSDCRGPAAALETPVQGFTSVCTQQTLSVESRCRSTRKRVVDTDSEQFSHKVRASPSVLYTEPMVDNIRQWETYLTCTGNIS